MTCLRLDLVVIEVARVWVRVMYEISETRSGCNRSCPGFGQGAGDLSETRSGCNRSYPSLGQGTGDLSETRSVVIVVCFEISVLLTCLI